VTTNPTLSSEIHNGLNNSQIVTLAKQTLAEDLTTFHVKKPNELAELTFQRLIDAGGEYVEAAKELALEIYPKWEGSDVRKLYHDYNWAVERKGSAEVALPHIRGTKMFDIGGGPGTFSLEVLKKKRDPEFRISIADINDWRNDAAKANPQIAYRQISIGGSFPFEDEEFDTGTLLYVLHHVETDHADFLKECARCIRSTLILFEDVKVDLNRGLPERMYRAPRPLEGRFLELSLKEQNQFIAVVDYICNHIASRELSMPVPGKYFEFHELEDRLKQIFPLAQVEKHYHGIYDTKCYPNPEAMYVIHFNRGAV
jgi:2-polyprenyl-3-methyl-5-hydroxy-6-metoxy-1,4-benzoquinol methylase